MVFTLATQAAIGLFAVLFLWTLADVLVVSALAATSVCPIAVLVSLGLVALGLVMSTVHLGKPIRFYRGFNNLRYSPAAREGAGVTAFMALGGLHLLATLPAQPWPVDAFPWIAGLQFPVLSNALGGLALASAGFGLYYMVRCYRIKARPFWNHQHTGFAFVGCAVYLGAAAFGIIAMGGGALLDLPTITLLPGIAGLMAVGLALEGCGLWLHARDMLAAYTEGAVSHYVQRTTFGKTWIARNALLVLTGACLLAVAAVPASLPVIWVWPALVVAALVVALTGRVLFYVLVVPTTMPGAFFWKNKGFEQHARDIGLDANPAVGVARAHH